MQCMRHALCHRLTLMWHWQSLASTVFTMFSSPVETHCQSSPITSRPGENKFCSTWVQHKYTWTFQTFLQSHPALLHKENSLRGRASPPACLQHPCHLSHPLESAVALSKPVQQLLLCVGCYSYSFLLAKLTSTLHSVSWSCHRASQDSRALTWFQLCWCSSWFCVPMCGRGLLLYLLSARNAQWWHSWCHVVCQAQ